MRLAERIAAAAASKKCLTVPLSAFLSGNVEGEIKMRPLFVAETNKAVEAAFNVRKSLVASLPESHARQFLDDPSFLEDVKVCEVLWHACRDADDVAKHAFPSSGWMREHMTNDELAALDHQYQRACQAEVKVPELFNEDQKWAIVRACSDASGSPLADAIIGRLPHVVLADLFVWLASEHIRGGAKAALAES